MKKFIDEAGQYLQGHSLWLAAIGLMVASSSLDGVYLSRWTPGFPLGGFILNTVADVSTLVISYHINRHRNGSDYKRALAASENRAVSLLITVGFSWLFTWRYLRPVIFGIEAQASLSPLVVLEWWPLLKWVFCEVLAALFSGFVPLMLWEIGRVQGIGARREWQKDDAPKMTQQNLATLRVVKAYQEGNSPELQAEIERAKAAEIDALYLPVLNYYRKNAHVSYAETASAVGCSPSTARGHVGKLVEAGVMRFSGKTPEVI
jgi:hypothetical protein